MMPNVQHSMTVQNKPPQMILAKSSGQVLMVSFANSNLHQIRPIVGQRPAKSVVDQIALMETVSWSTRIAARLGSMFPRASTHFQINGRIPRLPASDIAAPKRLASHHSP